MRSLQGVRHLIKDPANKSWTKPIPLPRKASDASELLILKV
jgi:hypothetical protein